MREDALVDLSGMMPELVWTAVLTVATLVRGERAQQAAAIWALGTPPALAVWASLVADTPLASDAPEAVLVFHSHGHTLIPLLLGYTLCYVLAQVLPTVAFISQLPEAGTPGRIFLLALFLPIYFIGGYLLDGRVRGVETVWHHPGGRIEVVTGGVWTGPWSTSLQLEDFACVVRRAEHCHEEDGEEDCSDVFRPVLGGLDGQATVLAAYWDQASAAARCTAFMELRAIHED